MATTLLKSKRLCATVVRLGVPKTTQMPPICGNKTSTERWSERSRSGRRIRARTRGMILVYGPARAASIVIRVRLVVAKMDNLFHATQRSSAT